jgi:hypothetical protein
MCDMRMSGLRVGHALIDLVPAGDDEEGPSCTARIEFQPMVGVNRTETIRFFKAEQQPDPGGLVMHYRTRPSDRRSASNLWLVRGDGQPPALYVDWATRFGKILILPEGRVKIPA